VAGKHDGKLILVPVRIQNKGPFWFCVDSGASHTVIDPYIVDLLKLKPASASSATGTGEGSVNVGHVGALPFQLGTVTLTVDDPWVIDLSGVPIPKWVHGLVGAEFFENFVVELEPNRPRLSLYKPQQYKSPQNAASLPLIVEDHKFFLTVKIEVNPKETVEHKLRIDTGSSDSIADEIVKKGSQVKELVIGRGLGKDFKAYSGLVQAVYVGPFKFSQVWGPGAPHPAIGMEIFRRFTTIFDISRRSLYLVPNQHMNEPVPAPQQ
jgi:hypothetical protein